MRRLSRVLVAGLCAAGFVVALAGCSGDSGIDAVTRPKASEPTNQARRQLADPRSPASTVLRFWNAIDQGALPLALALYEPTVVSSVGIATFAGMLHEQRATAQQTRLNVLRVEDVARPPGRLVTAEAVPKVGAKITHSFFLRRVRRERRARWHIVYDTLSVSAIESYVQTRTQRSINPSAAPGRKAVAAGDQAADAYRRAALAPAPAGDRTTRAPRAEPRPQTATTP